MRFFGCLMVSVALLWSVGCSSSRPADDEPGAKQPREPQVEVAPLMEALATIRTPFRAAAERERTALATRAGEAPRYRKAMTETVEARGGEFHFSLPDGPSGAVAPLRAALDTLPLHAIPTEDYPIQALDDAVEKVRGAASKAAPLRDALRALPGWGPLESLVAREDPPTESDVEHLLQDDRLEDLTAAALATLVDAVKADCAAREALLDARIALELTASEAFFRFAMDMKFRIKAHPFKAHTNLGQAVRNHHDGLMAAFDAFARDPEAGLKALLPAHPYYLATVEGLALYRKFAEAGPFKPLPGKAKLKRGSRGAAVQDLVERLAQEGYWDGPIPSMFNEDVENAVKQYQATHGFNEDGILEARHLTSLNVPVETRIRQIELSLQRWRESEVRHHEPTYVRVNLPEFMMEVWADGELALKHRIVCGNNNWDVDPDARIEGRLNRTKLFTSNIETIAINPRWHVPARIRKLELDFELLNDPTYYQKHNFVVKVLPDGRELIYQDAGDSNALGRVKFVFPNPYGIFMHDTNAKKFFDREIRAFSHGCIRLQEPFVVAKLLIERANGMTAEQVIAIRNAAEPRDVKLKTPVPIFLEYNSVGVAPDGRMMFFSDIYGYDRDYFDGKIPYSDEELKTLQRKIQKVD